MIIDINGNLPTTLTKVLNALKSTVVNVNGCDYVVKAAHERDDHGVDLVVYPWDEDNDAPLLQVVQVIHLDDVEKIEVV